MTRNMVFYIFIVIFDCFDSEEHKSQSKRKHQEEHQHLAHAKLRGMYGQRHGQAAANQYDCIGGAQFNIERAAAPHKGVVKPIAIDQVSGEHAAKEHDFGDKKHPHAEGSSVLLLLHIVEMVLQHGVMRRVLGRLVDHNRAVRQMLPPVPWSNRRLLRLRSGLLRNYAAAAAMWSAIPGWLRPRDCLLPPRQSEASTEDKSWAADIQ